MKVIYLFIYDIYDMMIYMMIYDMMIYMMIYDIYIIYDPFTHIFQFARVVE